eukprot:m.76552 g.76552  ORF g.76552 m.76552 type:complete len:395 (-) comp12563_c0_seq6:24-1208(-)
MYLLLLTTSTLSAMTTGSPGAPCQTDIQCSLNGECVDGICICDEGWSAPDCGVLNLMPAVNNSGYNLTGLNPPVSSWGANIFSDAKNIWHMYASEFENHCDISHWSPNSHVIHATSSTGPLGPYSKVGEAVPAFAHNPKVVQAPDGTWLMYTIGTNVPQSKLANCTSEQLNTPGRTPENLESNITLYTAANISGPWTRFGIVLGSDSEGSWDEDTSNPSPWVFPNGTVLLMYRGCKLDSDCNSTICGCRDEYIGLSSAPSWKGPYTRLTVQGPILSNISAEDPSMWVDFRGRYHFLMHYISDQQLVARHGFAESFLGPWFIHTESIPYNTTVLFTDGSVVQYHKRERPQLVFDSYMVPQYLITGAVLPVTTRGYSGKSFTLIQEISRRPITTTQ